MYQHKPLLITSSPPINQIQQAIGRAKRIKFNLYDSSIIAPNNIAIYFDDDNDIDSIVCNPPNLRDQLYIYDEFVEEIPTDLPANAIVIMSYFVFKKPSHITISFIER